MEGSPFDAQGFFFQIDQKKIIIKNCRPFNISIQQNKLTNAPLLVLSIIFTFSITDICKLNQPQAFKITKITAGKVNIDTSIAVMEHMKRILIDNDLYPAYK